MLPHSADSLGIHAACSSCLLVLWVYGKNSFHEGLPFVLPTALETVIMGAVLSSYTVAQMSCGGYDEYHVQMHELALGHTRGDTDIFLDYNIHDRCRIAPQRICRRATFEQVLTEVESIPSMRHRFKRQFKKL